MSGLGPPSVSLGGRVFCSAAVRVLFCMAATVAIIVTGCGPSQPSSCSATGADSYGTPYCPLSAPTLKALAEAHIVYPGSMTIWTAFDRGQLNVNGEPVAGDARGGFNTGDKAALVEGWYSQTLTAAGWTVSPTASPERYVRHPPNSEYCEYYLLSVYAGGVQGASWTPPPPGGTYYTTDLSVPSTELLGDSTPDQSGHTHIVRLPCN